MNSWEEFLSVLRWNRIQHSHTYIKKKQSKWHFWTKRYHSGKKLKVWFLINFCILLSFPYSLCRNAYMVSFRKGAICLIKPGCTLNTQPVTMATVLLWHIAYPVLSSAACCYGSLECHYFFLQKKHSR